MTEIAIIDKCLGLNNRTHPTKLYSENGQYLSEAINVDITDEYGIARRLGTTPLVSSLVNAHSLSSFMDRYALFADGTNLYCFDTQEEALSTLTAEITADAPISYTDIGDALWWSNGRERGVIRYTAGTVENTAWPELLQTIYDTDREIAEFPLVDLLHYFSGSLYGAARGEMFVYVSIPYRPTTIDALAGYLAVPGGINWVSNVDDSLVVGTDEGIFAYLGNGVSSFKQRRIHHKRSILCSEWKAYSDFNGRQSTGIITLSDDGVHFVSNDLSVTELSKKVLMDWKSFRSGSFGLYNNSFIFSGVTND